MDRHRECHTLLVGGGVSANSLLRDRLKALAAKRAIDLRLPAMEYCLDNGAMIAALGHDLLVERGWTSDSLAMTASPATGF
jgi:N6-L-threonylcarbamoyladenine synthase